jgi:hypothetical protein
MRASTIAAAVLALAAASPATAQLQNRSLAFESGISAPLSSEGGGRPAFALAAAAWIEGSLEVTARVAVATAAETAGRAPVTTASGTAGLRASLLPDPLRPQLGVEVGWARVAAPAGAEDRVAFAATAGLEWFPVRDLSIAARAALRGAGGALSVELTLGAAAYF